MAATREQLVTTMARGTAMSSEQAAFVTDGLIAMGGGGLPAGLLFDDTSGVVDVSYDGTTVWEWGHQQISNIEPTPITVNTLVRAYSDNPTQVGEEGAALYMRVEPQSPSNATHGIYIETSATNSQESTGIKMIHNGLNDAVYIAGFSAAAALETASFKNGSTGFISTCQWEAPDFNARDFGNTTLFNAVWGDDGTGGSHTPPNFGVFYTALSLGNSFRTRLQDPNATGWAWGRVEIAVSSYDLSRNHFDVYNHGQLNVRSRAADAGTPQTQDAHLRTSSGFWNGSSNVDYAMKFQVLPNGADSFYCTYVGQEGSEALSTCIRGSDAKMVFNNSTFILADRKTPASAVDIGTEGEMGFDSDYIYCCVADNTWKRAALTTW